jgi:hypothetical protein
MGPCVRGLLGLLPLRPGGQGAPLEGQGPRERRVALVLRAGSLATGSAFEIRFKERLGFYEDLVDPEDFRARTAAVMVALAMAKPGAGKALKPWPPSSLRARRRTFDDKYGPLKSGSTHHRDRNIRRLLAGG